MFFIFFKATGMDDLEFSYEELILEKGNYQGSYIYKDQKNNIFNDQGKILNQSKFETLFGKDTKQQTYNLEEREEKQEKQEKNKKEEREEREQREQREEMSNSQTVALAYEYTTGIVDILLEKFEGKDMGSEDLNKEVIMKELFGDYKPGDKVKKEKKVKKPRALTGYTYFAKQNKEKFNEEMEKLDEKPKYVEYLGQQWKKLSKDEKGEWDKKAKEEFENSKGE